MFDAYRDDSAVYTALEQHICQRFAAGVSDSERYAFPFLNLHFGDGRAMQDANPLFSARDTTLNRAVCVVLDENGTEVRTHCLSAAYGIETVVVGAVKHLAQIEHALARWLIAGAFESLHRASAHS